MGYTHYWNQKRDVAENEWDCIKTGYHHMHALLPLSKQGPILRGWDGNGMPEVNDNIIAFNGDASVGHDHETFRITRLMEDDFTFCKTAIKPYDLAVMVMLLIVSECAPGAFDISSDGDMRGDDWKPARDLLRRKDRIE